MYNKDAWSFLFDDNEPVVNFKDELKYNFKRWFIDLLSIIPFLTILTILFIYNKINKKNKKNKILLGTVPIITFNLLSKSLTNNQIDNTLFVFQDWSNGNFHTGLTFKDICPISFTHKNPYEFGSYIAFIWALRNFDIFCLYFNSGFLERTIFWKIEPVLYQIFNKKTLMLPYGSDVWSIKQNKNRVQKLGHMMSTKKFFLLDKKREERIYHWSKYVNLIIAYASYMDYLQRIDILVYHGQIVEDVNNYNYNFSEKNDIKVIHYANDNVRKGSMYIEAILAKTSNSANIEFYYGIERALLLSKLEESHFYIEQLIDGIITYSCLEAMLKGKIVFLYLDSDINDVYRTLNSSYYIDFFNNSPIVNINLENLNDKVQEYLNKDFKELQDISIKSRDFATKLLLENEQMYVAIFNKLKS